VRVFWGCFVYICKCVYFYLLIFYVSCIHTINTNRQASYQWGKAWRQEDEEDEMEGMGDTTPAAPTDSAAAMAAMAAAAAPLPPTMQQQQQHQAAAASFSFISHHSSSYGDKGPAARPAVALGAFFSYLYGKGRLMV
jgi:hypothetical protein